MLDPAECAEVRSTCVQAKQRSLREQRQKQWQQIEKKAAQRAAVMQR